MEQKVQNVAKQPNHTTSFVDFTNTEACSGSRPVSCSIGGINIPFVGNWRDLLVAITEYCMSEFAEKANKLKSEWFSNYSSVPFLLSAKPSRTGKELSNGYWINVHYSISQLVLIIAGLCRYCGINLNNIIIGYTSNQGDGIELLTVKDFDRFAQPNVRSAFKEWLMERYPDWGPGTVQTHYSDAYYLCNNDCGITLAEALTTDNDFQRAYDVIEQYFAANPTQTINPAGSARGYLRSLRMLKEFLMDKFPSLLNFSGTNSSTVPDSVFSVLIDDYASGFRFDVTALRLLSGKSKVEVDENMQLALKRRMFCRDDGIYFLFDLVTDAETRKDIVDYADSLLTEFGCFEVPELYVQYADRLNEKIVSNADDFEKFYEQIGNQDVRCVAAPYIGNRIARFSNTNVWGNFEAIADKIIVVANDEFCGVISEDDLHTRFCAFSTDLLAKIIKHRAEDRLVRTEINGIVCYQTLDALGLPENFSDTLAETLERLDELNLTPNEEVLHTALSLALGVNFKVEYNLPSQEIYRRLIAVYYKGEPRRQWYRGVFGEATN